MQPDNYVSSLKDNFTMSVSFIGHVAESGRIISAKDDFMIDKPVLDIEVRKL